MYVFILIRSARDPLFTFSGFGEYKCFGVWVELQDTFEGLVFEFEFEPSCFPCLSDWVLELCVFQCLGEGEGDACCDWRGGEVYGVWYGGEERGVEV